MIYGTAEVPMYWRFSTGDELAREQKAAARLRAGSKFYRFLFEVREELFDEDFQAELVRAYGGRGQEPCPPAFLAMVNLLQRYTGLGDRAAVETAENDRRWQIVLGTLGLEQPGFGQGSLVRFRERMAAHDLDKKLLERTVELAKKTKKFGWKNLKVALDSSPLEGAGRVEDTWNLIGTAMRRLVVVVAKALGVDAETVIEAAGLTLFDAPSVKAALDIDWSDPDERHDALQTLLAEADALSSWVLTEVDEANDEGAVSEALSVLHRVVEQDTEPDPDGGGMRIREGVAEDRVISISDPDMRHGRKSKSKTINGYKRHIAIANRIVLGTAIEPANRREHEPAAGLLDAARRHGKIRAAQFDRGYLSSPEVPRLHRDGVQIDSRPWRKANDGRFTKEDFHVDLDAGGVVCPAGNTARIPPGGTVNFDRDDCGRCALRPQCTNAARRSLRIHPQERLLQDLREAQSDAARRADYRTRVEVEHRLAHLQAVQGGRARYCGKRKNELDLNRAAAVINLQEVSRLRRAA